MCKINYKCFNQISNMLKDRFSEFVRVNNETVDRQFMSKVSAGGHVVANTRTASDLVIVYENSEFTAIDINGDNITFHWISKGVYSKATLDIVMFDEGPSYWEHVISEKYQDRYNEYLSMGF